MDYWTFSALGFVVTVVLLLALVSIIERDRW